MGKNKVVSFEKKQAEIQFQGNITKVKINERGKNGKRFKRIYQHKKRYLRAKN